MKKTKRRTFIKNAGLAAGSIAISAQAVSAKSYQRILGANERIGTAIMGCYRRFGGLAQPLSNLEATDITYVCDVDSRRQDAALEKVKKWSGSMPKGEKDFRKILEDKEVDALFVACPDHWHAPAAWIAMQAGKNVYVEKPCSHNPHESALLVAMQKKYGKVVQMGNQQRSSLASQEIIKEIHNGIIGHAYMAKAFYSNQRGRVPNAQKVPVPDYLDWNLFQGPAPRTDFIDIAGDYNWHWFWRWGTGETGNNATHELDIGRWALQVTIPHRVVTHAGKYHYKDDPWTMYDTMLAHFDFPGGKTISWDGKSRNGHNTYGGGRGTIIYGSEGSVFVNRSGYKLFDRAGKMIKEGSEQGSEASTALGGGGDITTTHIQNFLNAIRGKDTLNAPIEGGALSTNLCHYANISYRMGNQSLEIDPANGKFKNDKAMNRYWQRDYEKGWEPPKV